MTRPDNLRSSVRSPRRNVTGRLNYFDFTDTHFLPAYSL
jgi:hypothetical protein